MKDLVILSVYDSGYFVSLLENDTITEIDDTPAQEAFKSRFGKYPDQISVEELREHYPEGTIVIICDNGGIYK